VEGVEGKCGEGAVGACSKSAVVQRKQLEHVEANGRDPVNQMGQVRIVSYPVGIGRMNAE
jgi:hypothetical protein